MRIAISDHAVIVDFPFSDAWTAFPIWYAAIIAATPLTLALAACWFVSLCDSKQSSRGREQT